MAAFKNGHLTVNGTDLSTYVRSMELPISAEMLDDTTMGDDARVNEAGLLTWNVTAELKQVFASVDAVLHPLVGAAAFPVIIKPDGATTSTSNPAFTGNAVIESYQPFGGQVGNSQTCSVTLQCSGTLSRATV
jgi:hypothetical protein